MDQYATAANLPSGLAPVSTDQSVFTLRTAENTLYTLTKIFNYGSYRTILFRNGTVAQDGTPLLKLRNSPFAFTAGKSSPCGNLVSLSLPSPPLP